MSITIVLKILETVLENAPLAINSINSLYDLREELKAFNGRDPTPEEWAELDEKTTNILISLNSRAIAAQAIIDSAE